MRTCGGSIRRRCFARRLCGWSLLCLRRSLLWRCGGVVGHTGLLRARARAAVPVPGRRTASNRGTAVTAVAVQALTAGVLHRRHFQRLWLLAVSSKLFLLVDDWNARSYWLRVNELELERDDTSSLSAAGQSSRTFRIKVTTAAFGTPLQGRQSPLPRVRRRQVWALRDTGGAAEYRRQKIMGVRRGFCHAG